jgi:predicted GNAT superfamily acetyltransferase
MTLWADYILEREGCKTIENEHGFLTFKEMPDGVIFIRDMFVHPSKRDSGVGQELFLELSEWARRADFKRCICQVDTRAGEASESLAKFLAKGFRLEGAQNCVITLSRSIEHNGWSC